MKNMFLSLCLLIMYPIIVLGSSDPSAVPPGASELVLEPAPAAGFRPLVGTMSPETGIVRGSPAGAPADPLNNPVVRFLHEGHYHYILGTTHTEELRKPPFNLDYVDALYLEHDGECPVHDPDFPKGKNHDAVVSAFPQIFPSDILVEVQEYASKMSADAAIALALLNHNFKKRASAYSEGMDETLFRLFKGKNKTIEYLEKDTYGSLLRPFSSLPLLSYAILENPLFVQKILNALLNPDKPDIPGSGSGSSADESSDHDGLGLNLSWDNLWYELPITYSDILRNIIMAEAWLKRENKTQSSLIAVGADHLLRDTGIVALLMKELPDTSFELWQGGESWSPITRETDWVSKGVGDIKPKEIGEIIQEVLLAGGGLSAERMKELASLWIEKAFSSGE